MIYPSAYIWPQFGGWFNPYFGGFGHYNLPPTGAGYTWPGFTFPFILQTPGGYAAKAGFMA